MRLRPAAVVAIAGAMVAGTLLPGRAQQPAAPAYDPLNFPICINNRIALLNRVVNAGDGKPIAVAYEIFNDVSAELKVETDRLTAVLAKDLPAFNAEAKRAGVEPLDGARCGGKTEHTNDIRRGA